MNTEITNLLSTFNDVAERDKQLRKDRDKANTNAPEVLKSEFQDFECAHEDDGFWIGVGLTINGMEVRVNITASAEESRDQPESAALTTAACLAYGLRAAGSVWKAAIMPETVPSSPSPGDILGIKTTYCAIRPNDSWR